MSPRATRPPPATRERSAPRRPARPRVDPVDAGDPVDAQLVEVARRVRHLRAEAHLTLHELAHRSGVATSTIQKVETGQMVPSIAVLLKIARGLDRPIADLLADHAPRPRPRHTASPPRPPRSAPSSSQRDKRDQILSAAVDVLLREGVQGCTARAIATAAGVSNGAVHYYFHDVEEIVDLAMLHATEGWIAWLRTAGSADPTGAPTPSARFWQVVHACLAPFAGGDRTLMPLWLEYWASRTRAGRLEPLRTVEGRLVAFVAELAAGAGIDEADERAVAVTAYLFGTGMQEAVGGMDPGIVDGHIAALCGIDVPTR